MLEEIIDKLKKTKPCVIFDSGSATPYSDHDMQVLYLYGKELENAFEYITHDKELLDKLKEENATLFLVDSADYKKFRLSAYKIGSKGIGRDIGWVSLAPHIRIHFSFSTAEVLYPEKDTPEYQSFLTYRQNVLNLIESSRIPVNEPYELYFVTKWTDYYDYLVTGDDKKLAKSVLRLLYALLAMDDGHYRKSYKEISENAHLINLGRAMQYFGITKVQLDDLPDIKEGKKEFGDDKEKFEDFFALIGELMNHYIPYLNFSGEAIHQSRITEFLKYRLSEIGGVESVIKTLLSKKKYTIVANYLPDIIKYIDPSDKKQIALLEKVDKVLDEFEIFNKEMDREEDLFNAYNHFLIKYTLNKLNVEDLESFISMLENDQIKIKKIIYSIRGLNRSESSKRKMLSDLYLLLSKIKKDYSSSEMFDKIKYSLVYDPVNIDKLNEFVKYLNVKYKRNFILGNPNSLIVDDIYGSEYKDILIHHFEQKIADEIEPINKMRSARSEITDSTGLLDFIAVHAYNKVLFERTEELKEIMKELGLTIVDYINEIFDGKWVNSFDAIVEALISFSGIIYLKELEPHKILEIEHDINLEYERRRGFNEQRKNNNRV